MPRWLVDIPQVREAPPELRRRLRALDPRYEIINVGPTWWVGLVTPDPSGERRLTAWHILRRESKKLKPNWSDMRMAKLMQQGFQYVGEYTDAQLNEGMLNDLRYASWMWRTHGEAGLEDLERTSARDGTEERIMRKTLENVRGGLRDAIRYYGRGARSVAVH